MRTAGNGRLITSLIGNGRKTISSSVIVAGADGNTEIKGGEKRLFNLEWPNNLEL